MISCGFTILTVCSPQFVSVNGCIVLDGISVQNVVLAINVVALYRSLSLNYSLPVLD